MQNKLTKNQSNILDDSKLFGGVTYECCVNSDTDLIVGTTASAKIEFITDKTVYSGDSWTYEQKQENYDNFQQVGIFNLYSKEKASANRTKVVAYDNIIKFDKDVKTNFDSYWTQNRTVGQFFSALCGWCGCTAYSTTFTNSSLVITEQPVTGNQINGRELLSYIAAVAGGFIVAESDGKIRVKHFAENTNIPYFTKSLYKSLNYTDFSVPVIDVVRVANKNDTGLVWPLNTSGNTLNIQYNAIFYNEQLATMQQYVHNIYDVVHAYTYVPVELELFCDIDSDGYKVNVGDKIRFQYGTSAQSYYSYVFTKKVTPSGVYLYSTGRKSRELLQTTDGAILQLNNKYKIVKDTVDEHSIEIGENTQAINTVTNEVTTARGSSASLRAELGRIESRVSSSVQTSRGSTPPVQKNEGDLWFCTQDYSTYKANHMYRWSGTAWEIVDMAPATLDTTIGQYIDTAAGTAKVVTAASGTYLRQDTAANTYDTKTHTAQIEARVDSNESNIELVVDTSGSSASIKASAIVDSINGASSEVKISADHVEVETSQFVVKSNLYDGQTTISGDNILTGTISADRISAGSIAIGKLDNTTQTKINNALSTGDNISRLTNNAGYQNATGVTSIVNGTVTTDYVNALNVTAGSVAATNLTGDTLASNVIKLNGSMYIPCGPTGNLYFTNSDYSSNAGFISLLNGNNKVMTISSPQNIILNCPAQSTIQMNAIITGGNSLRPVQDDSLSCGSSGYRWTAVYAKTGSIQTSDRNSKEDIDYDISSMDSFFDNLKPAKFKFKDGTSGRIHYGMVSQDVEDNLIEHGMTGTDFAGFCKDTKSVIVDEYGNEIEVELETPIYSLRYDEFMALCIKQIQDLKARVAELESKQNEK